MKRCVVRKETVNKNSMTDWQLEIAFHWPHNRFAFGWEHIGPDDTADYVTIKVYLGIVTLTLDLL